MRKRTPLERLEDLATERLGRGAAISLDRSGVFTVATAWDARGRSRVACSRGTRQEAIAALRRLLLAAEGAS